MPSTAQACRQGIAADEQRPFGRRRMFEIQIGRAATQTESRKTGNTLAAFERKAKPCPEGWTEGKARHRKKANGSRSNICKFCPQAPGYVGGARNLQ